MNLEGMIIKVDGKLYVFVLDTVSCPKCPLNNLICSFEVEEVCGNLPMGHFEELKDV